MESEDISVLIQDLRDRLEDIELKMNINNTSRYLDLYIKNMRNACGIKD